MLMSRSAIMLSEGQSHFLKNMIWPLSQYSRNRSSALSGKGYTVPDMNYILVSLLPLVLVRKTKYPSLAAANGQFMFFRSSRIQFNEAS